jgi:ATP-dependent DNA helicase RecG
MQKEVTRKEPRFYMEKAIDVMKNSIPEKNKSNPSPNVGAVIVFPDGTFDTASRGELREGDHAEYTLLDKKYRNRDLSDCWLFATLEPCAPGSRKEPKLSCAERIANTRIKNVWYGVQELNPNASGGKIYLEKMGVTVLPFDSDLHHKIKDYNKSFDIWAEEEAKRKSKEIPILKGSLQDEVKNADINSLSDKALQLYIEKPKMDLPCIPKNFF